MKIFHILVFIFGIVLLFILLFVVIPTKNARINDCINELDAFKEYYDASEEYINAPDTICNDSIYTVYNNAKRILINTYNANHPDEIPLDKKIVER